MILFMFGYFFLKICFSKKNIIRYSIYLYDNFLFVDIIIYFYFFSRKRIENCRVNILVLSLNRVFE